MSPSSIPWEKRYYRFLAGLGRSSLLQHPTHSTYASACICALSEMRPRIRTRHALPAQAVAAAGCSHVSRKTRESEPPGNHDVTSHDFVLSYAAPVALCPAPPSIIRLFVVTEEVLGCPHAGKVSRLDKHPRPLLH